MTRRASTTAGDDTPTPTVAPWRPSTDEEWAGRARMALARRDAGQPLDELDMDCLVWLGPTSSQLAVAS